MHQTRNCFLCFVACVTLAFAQQREIAYKAQLVGDETSDVDGDFTSSRPVLTLTKSNKVVMVFDIQPPIAEKSTFHLKHSTLFTAKLSLHVHSCDARDESLRPKIIGSLFPIGHVKGSKVFRPNATMVGVFNTTNSRFEMNFVAGLRPYIYDDDRLQDLKSKKFRVKIELVLSTASSEITFIQFYSSRHGKDPSKAPVLLLKFTTETFASIEPRIVPNNFFDECKRSWEIQPEQLLCVWNGKHCTTPKQYVECVVCIATKATQFDVLGL